MTAYYPTWILVADASRARLFNCDGSGSDLKMLKEWDHPQSRAKNQELQSDRPGRTAQSHVGLYPKHGSKSAMEPDVLPKRLEHEHFARQLADVLDKGLAQHLYDRLILVANPEFLGILRRVMAAQLLKHVVASIDKDYSTLTPRKLHQHLFAS
jgi:protein required for attachment to host cells